jgi:hypothetical protein
LSWFVIRFQPLFAADDVRRRHPHVVVVTALMSWLESRLSGSTVMPGVFLVDDDHRDALVLGRVGIGADREPAVVGVAGEADVHIFWPLMTYSSPSRSARVFSDARSVPASGSE